MLNKFNQVHCKLRTMIVLIVPLLIASCGTRMPPLPAPQDTPVVQVGVLSPTSGELAVFGRNLRNGILMAFDRWNDRNEAYRLDWVLYNTDCTFESAQQAMQQAIEDGVKFVIGPICSEAAIGAAEQAQASQTLLLAPAATHPLVTVDRQGAVRPTVFRVSYDPGLQGKVAANFARNLLGAKRAALLTRAGDDYAARLTDRFAEQFQITGGQVVYENRYVPNSVDVSRIVADIQQAEADLIYLPTDVVAANQVSAELNAVDWPETLPRPRLMGSDAWESSQLDLTAVNQANFPVHVRLTDEAPAAAAWAAEYRARYATRPESLAALGFDAANILVEALEQSANLEPETIAGQIEQHQFEGVTGPISFDPNHNPEKPVPFLYVDNGQLRPVFK